MSDLSAREALRYATEDSMLTLFAVVLGGWLSLTFAGFAFSSYTFGMLFVLAVLVFLVGGLALFSGLVAITYKVLVDSRTA
ncbi:hypothetical protein [Haloferax profundi]|uniref:Transporter n=1 Tax=Haloferax profundi TaxID=1544718 RepID=A0A0W1R3U7_9EURY|nr:hypothetical protein [Haloferax profundi]KTG08060.1 hypothetical protein AUR66_04410 [Haloferax profundi]